MPLRLRVIPSGKAKGRTRKAVPGERAIEFDDGVGQIRIGRRPDLELSLPFSPLSGVHARLVRVGGAQGAGGTQSEGWLLEDLGSTNGCLLRGASVDKPVALSDGDAITIGSVELRVYLWNAEKAAETARIPRKR